MRLTFDENREAGALMCRLAVRGRDMTGRLLEEGRPNVVARELWNCSVIRSRVARPFELLMAGPFFVYTNGCRKKYLLPRLTGTYSSYRIVDRGYCICTN